MQIIWLRTLGGRWHDSAGYKNVLKRKRTYLIIAWLANESLAIRISMISISENKLANEPKILLLVLLFLFSFKTSPLNFND